MKLLKKKKNVVKEIVRNLLLIDYIYQIIYNIKEAILLGKLSNFIN